MIWLTSDTHFGHHSIIKFCSRPFSCVEQMNAALINKWNACVSRKDEVYHLGDFSFCSYEETADIVSQLKGKITLIRGNHDSAKKCELFHEWHWYKRLRYNNRTAILCHFPFESWDGMHGGAKHFHGHSHGNSRPMNLRLDVGVDCHQYAPISFETAVELAYEKGTDSI